MFVPTRLPKTADGSGKASSRMIDRLTGLPGRELLDDLRARFAASARHEPWTVMMIDVDQFKLINDTYGHLLGDMVLAEVGAVLRHNTRSGDAVLRYGGDEFLAVFPGTPAHGAVNYARRVSEAVLALGLPHAVKLSLSVGVAERLPEEDALDEVLARADRSLYRAKGEGRGRVVVFDPHAVRHPPDELAFTHLVGRQRELRVLRQMLDETLTKGAGLALIMGDIGVGKTRLAQEVAKYGAFRGCAVRWSGYTEFGPSEPYSFLIRPFQSLLSGLKPHELEQVQRTVGSVHPASLNVLPGFPAADHDRFFADDGLRFRVFDDVVRVLQALTLVQPLMLVVEDAHWMPRHDLDLLAYLLRAACDAAFFVLLNMRHPGDPSAVAESVIGLAGSVPSARVQLGNLGADDVASLLALTLGDPAIPFEVLGTLYRQSGGNPFFLRELLLALCEDGSIAAGEHGGWIYRIGPEPGLPDSLTQAISRRVHSLSELTVRLLKAASLAGGPFSVALIADALERSDLEVAAGLEEALRAGVIAELSGTPEPSYVFVHDMVRAFVSGELPSATKTLLHERMGRFCERLLKAGRDDMLPATAHHFALGSDHAKATEYALRAAKAAATRHAARETLRWVCVFLEHAEERHETRENLLWAYRTRGECLSLTGEGAEADASLSRALELAEDDEEKALILSRMGDNAQKLSQYAVARDRYGAALELTHDAVGRADLLVSLVYLDYLQGRPGEAMARLDEAKTLLESAPESTDAQHVWAAYHKRMGDISQELADPRTALTHYRTSLRLYRDLGDRVGESAVVNNMSSCHSATGELEKSLELLFEAARLNAQIGDVLGLAIAHYNIAETYGSLNQVRLARDYYQRYLDTSARIGNELGKGYGHFGLGYLAWLENRLPEAEAWYRSSAEVFDRLQTGKLAVMSLIRLVEVLFEQGKTHEGCEELARLQAVVAFDADEARVEMPYLEAMRILGAAEGTPPQGCARAIDLLAAALTHIKADDLAGRMKSSYLLALAQERQGAVDAARETLGRALASLRVFLARIANHAYRSSVLEAREVRRVREAYERLSGSRWDPHASDTV